jgi:hypothetical protein
MRLKSYLHSLVLVLVWHDLCSIEFDVYFNFDRESKRQDSMLKKKSELFLANSQTYNSIFAIKNQAQEDAKNLQESLKKKNALNDIDKSGEVRKMIQIMSTTSHKSNSEIPNTLLFTLLFSLGLENGKKQSLTN